LTFANFRGNDWYVFVFTATEFSGDLSATSPEGQLAWIDDAELTRLNLWPSDHIFLPWLAQGQFFSARFQYDGEVMGAHAVSFH
jgi:8-oxo-dGTP diphosphatase